MPEHMFKTRFDMGDKVFVLRKTGEGYVPVRMEVEGISFSIAKEGMSYRYLFTPNYHCYGMPHEVFGSLDEAQKEAERRGLWE